MDPDYQGNDGGVYEYAYFLPGQNKSPFTAKSSLDLHDTEGSTVTTNELVIHELGKGCQVIAVDVSRSNDLGSSSGSVTLYTWSVKDNSFKELDTFETSSKLDFVPSSDGSCNDLQYTEGGNSDNVTLYKWNGTAFVKSTRLLK